MPALWNRIVALFNALTRKRNLDVDMEQEIRAHIELRTAANVEAGMNPEEARFAAMRQFGWVASIKEQCREQRGIPWLESLIQDVHYATRQLTKNPGFTLAAALTLAMGIGASVVVFSVAKTVLFRPLGFEGEDRLVWIRMMNTTTGAQENQISWQDAEDIRSSTTTFESISIDNSSDVRWRSGNRNETAATVHATPELTEALRLRPALGRLFHPSDADPREPLVVVIGHEFWQSHFGGRADVLGQTVSIENATRTIVGVLPPGVKFPVERAPAHGAGSISRPGSKPFWLPMRAPEGEDRVSRGARMFLAVGRLKPGVSEKAAMAEFDYLGNRLASEHPISNRNRSFTLVSFRDDVFGRTIRSAPLLVAAVLAVLSICCVNLANLLLARGVRRQRELAVRVALGAGRARLVRMLMTESAMLALLGGALSIVVAMGALKLIHHLAAGAIPFIHEARMDKAALGFSFLLSLLTALVFGLLPALRQTNAGMAEALRTGSRSTGGRQMRLWQRGLLVGQIAGALALLASAGLLLESFRRLVGQDLGYDSRSVITFGIQTDGEFETNGDVCRMYRVLRERLAALPEVEAVGTISSTPLTGQWTFNEHPDVVGNPLPEAERPAVAATFIAFDYFQAMSIPLVDGRFFRGDELKDDGYGQIVILNETAAALLFPNRSAVGGRFSVGSNPDRILEVVGVVKDTRDVRLDQQPQPRFYWHYAFGGAQVILKTKAPIAALEPMLRATVAGTDSRVQIDQVRPMKEIVASTVAERRFLMILVTTYAIVALAVAAVGIFGVVAYQVDQRRNEFGVRLALGANENDLLRLVLREVATLAALGLVIGLALTLITNRLLASQLFGLSPHDPMLLGIVSVVIFAVALTASFIPACRAARIHPMEALRHD